MPSPRKYTTRLCKRCGESKDLSAFPFKTHNRKLADDSIHKYKEYGRRCLECIADRKVQPPKTEKVCGKCCLLKSASEFDYRNASYENKDGGKSTRKYLRTWCKACIKLYNREYDARRKNGLTTKVHS